MSPARNKADDSTPTSGAPTANRNGITVPWAWLAGVFPLAAESAPYDALVAEANEEMGAQQP
jgi:hypothetical protein